MATASQMLAPFWYRNRWVGERLTAAPGMETLLVRTWKSDPSAALLTAKWCPTLTKEVKLQLQWGGKREKNRS